MLKEIRFVLVASSLFICAPALASIQTSPWSNSDSPKVVDFSQFGGGFTFTAGPIEIGTLVEESITWRTSHSTTVIGDPSFGLGNNGTWDSGRNGFTALNLASGYMDYVFANPVSGVGGFMSYAQFNDVPSGGLPQIIALDVNLNPIESYDLASIAPIITAIENDGAFRGITRETNDIYGFRVANSFAVLDDLTFIRSMSDEGNGEVPEPASLVAWSIISAVSVAFAWRKRVLARQSPRLLLGPADAAG